MLLLNSGVVLWQTDVDEDEIPKDILIYNLQHIKVLEVKAHLAMKFLQFA